MSQFYVGVTEGALPPSVPTTFTTDDGVATPAGNNLNIFGEVIPASGTPFLTSSNPPSDTVTISVQLATEVDSLVVDKSSFPGIASFNDDQFTVVDGFVSLVGSEVEPAIKSINVDASTAPGDDPVPSDPDGILTITGAQVDSGDIGQNVIRTNSLTDYSFTIEIQRSTATGISNEASNGVSHFNINDFSVNSSGFVQLAGSGAGKTITGNSGGAISPLANNWTLITANSTPKFIGDGPTATITLDFALTNLVLGSSLPSLAGGTLNVGLGFHALNAITSGQANTAVGYAAGLLITTATANTAVGHTALSNNISSSSNTAIGEDALGSLASGSGSNLALGISSLTNLGNGTRNIGIGSLAGSAYTSSESSNIIIGNAGVITESNIIRIGTQGSGVGQQTDCYLAGILHTTSGRTRNVTAPGAYPYTVLSTDDIISVSTAGGARTINLPNAPTTGTTYVLKDVSGNAAANNISVTTPGGVVTIDGATTYTINSNYGSITVYFNGTSYFVI